MGIDDAFFVAVGTNAFATMTRVDGATGDASFDGVFLDCAEVTYQTVDSVCRRIVVC